MHWHSAQCAECHNFFFIMAPQKKTHDVGATVSCLIQFLQPSELIQNKFPNPVNGWRLDGCITVQQELKKINRRHQLFIDCATCQRLAPYKHKNSLPNNLYATNICQRRSKSTKHQHQIALDVQHGNHPSTTVGSPQVSFLMCTLEIPQKNCSTSSLLLTLFTFTFEPFLKL